jgi:hypothetical protein
MRLGFGRKVDKRTGEKENYGRINIIDCTFNMNYISINMSKSTQSHHRDVNNILPGLCSILVSQVQRLNHLE